MKRIYENRCVYKEWNYKDKTMNCQIAICIPTYNNPFYISDIIQKEYLYYERNGITLVVADSSDNDDTERIVESENNKGSKILYYRFPSDIQSNEKVYLIYQMAGKEFECDYLWIRSDALRAHRYLLESIQYYLRFNCDLIVTTYRGDWKREITFSDDLQLLFDKYCWTLCLYGGAIINVHTMLENADWIYLKNRYLVENRRNFSHVCMYFERLLDIMKNRNRNPSILLMNLPGYIYSGTPKKTQSAWHNEIFKIWLEYWPDAIEALPDEYENKLEVIRSFGRNEIYYTENYLRKLCEQGILNNRVLSDYEERIKKYSGVPYQRFVDALDYSHIYNTDGVNYIEDEYRNLERFCKLYEKVAIYGCGKKAKRYLEFIKDKNINIDCFIVSDQEVEKNDKMYEGYTVKSLSDYRRVDNEGLILAMGAANQLSVLPVMEKMDYIDCLFAYPLLKLDDIDVIVELKNNRV